MHPIDVRDEPVDGTPSLGDDDPPILVPGGMHPELGPGWILFHLHASREVVSWHIPYAVAHDAEAADGAARQHLTFIGGTGWLRDT